VYIFKELGKEKLRANWVVGFSVKAIVHPDAFIVTNGHKDFRVNKCRIKKNTSKREDDCVVVICK
jgi:hypothetical protein